ncbi:Uncharacterized protein PRO82_000323 [Candidatus Protochlamydia amoebophila]|nr:Uncharacterized protein [Candidatus Protochlamydia amoebophila]
MIFNLTQLIKLDLLGFHLLRKREPTYLIFIHNFFINFLNIIS